MNELRQFLQSLGPSKIFVILGTSLGALAFVTYMILKSTEPAMALLFSQLEPADGARIMDRLEGMNVPVELRGDGSQIYVPADRIARLRMDLAQAGLPGSGSIGYEIFDKADILGTSSAVMDINYVRAMEGEIGKSIRSIQGVAAARVHLVLPKKEIFTRDRTEPSASIVLRMNRGRLSQGQVVGIQHLVAAAVPGLSAERITIVDDKGSLLARQSESGGFDIGNNMDLQRAQEQKLSNIVEALLEKTLGPGKARVEINAVMDFDKITLNSEEFDPDGQVVKSTSTGVENGTSTEQSGGGGGVSVQNSLPDAAHASESSGKNSTKNNRNDENTVYEISKTIKTHVKETGTVKKLSIAVLVDGKAGEDGKYQARTKEELDQITKLVKTSVGFNQERGDVIEVVNMAFMYPDETMLPQSMVDKMLSQVSIPSILNVAIPGLIGLLVILLFVKPFAVRILDQVKNLKPVEGAVLGLGGPRGVGAAGNSDAVITGMGAPQIASYGQVSPQNALASDQSPETIALKNTQGELKAAIVKQVREIVEANPQETVNLIRNWMTTSGA